MERGGRSAKLETEAQDHAEAARTAGPHLLAHHLIYADIIDPNELSNRILDGLAMLDLNDAEVKVDVNVDTSA